MAPKTTVALLVAVAAAAALVAHVPWSTDAFGAGAVPGMVYFAGGTTRIGAEDGPPSERPSRRATR